MQSRCKIRSRKASTMWTIHRFTTMITKGRVLLTGRDPTTGLNQGHLNTIPRTGITDAKGKNTIRTDEMIHLINMKTKKTCGDDPPCLCAHFLALSSFHAYMELWVFPHQDGVLVRVFSVWYCAGEEVYSRWKHSVWWSGHACVCMDHCPMALGLSGISSCGGKRAGPVHMYNRPGFLVGGRSAMEWNGMEPGEHA
jgi:hypothetical protein